MYYPSSENKGNDQLRGYRKADLRLCFHLCRLLVFPCGGSCVFLIFLLCLVNVLSFPHAVFVGIFNQFLDLKFLLFMHLRWLNSSNKPKTKDLSVHDETSNSNITRLGI